MIADRRTHLALTFDDGPEHLWTTATRRALDRCGVRATFFLIGSRAGERPGEVRSLRADGHTIEVHCHRHLRHSTLSEAEIEADVRTAMATIAAQAEPPRLWRTPWGVATTATRRVAERLGLRLVGWDIDTHDWRGDSATTMLTAVGPSLARGGSVLMHDGLGPGSRRSGCSNTVALLPLIVAAAEEAGLSVGPLPRDAE